MESRGTLTGIARNWQNGHFQLTFELEQDVSGAIDEIKEVPLTVTARRYKKKRSLDANAYYWQLLTKLAGVLDISKPHLHNLMLRRYGQPEIIEHQMMYLVLPDSESGLKQANEAETYHIRPTAQVKEGTDGKMYRTYLMLRGSSTYDTQEMSILIDGLIQECREQGIETMPQEEFDRMMAAYDQNWRKKHEEADERVDG